MTSFQRTVPWVAGFLIFIILMEIIKHPDFFYYLTPALFLIIILAVLFLTTKNIKSKKFWYFLISPALYLLGILSFIIFIELAWLKIFLAIVLSLILSLFLENIYLYNYNFEKYQTYGLQNFSNYLNLITVFFLFSSFFGFIIFLQIAVWLLLLAVAIISVLTVYQTMWVSRIELNRSWLYLMVITLLMAQGFWILAFLPTSIYVNGLILAAIYYLLVGLSLNRLLGILDRSVIKRYITVTVVVLTITLITAKWI